jgi:hypothetical protein
MVSSAIITLICTMLTVLIHFEVMKLMTRKMEKMARYGRRRFLILILALLLAQFAGITVFAFGYMALSAQGIGGILHADDTLLNYLYLSVSAYSTVGFGDVAPDGGARLMAGVEAVVGFMMITWSASLTFIEMQRHWSE